VELQQAADQSLSKPFPLGAGHDKFGLGFQIACSDPKYAKFRSVGSISWAGIYNTEFWIDLKRHIGVVMMMQVLPFYDEGAIRTLRDFEELVYQKARYPRPAARALERARASSVDAKREITSCKPLPSTDPLGAHLDYFRIVGQRK
jgi:CubicO group peptidase (beta-lactamase class C family)